ncbi:hypothetical protein L596_016836 [Steinernema carpocapsae]|uniref:Uncharacterized protein n=1 Tax=Steinernema carpocapsae TaxID=34508 RepID=A0A4U5NKQ2_STECR|nr:hypothetical protein L596_016836 [Steinernema carpocapsae]
MLKDKKEDEKPISKSEEKKGEKKEEKKSEFKSNKSTKTKKDAVADKKDGDGYEACPEIAPEQLAKIAEEAGK